MHSIRKIRILNVMGTSLTSNTCGNSIITGIIIIVLQIIFGAQAVVDVGVHHRLKELNTDPALNIKYRFAVNTSLDNFKLTCLSLEPVEWVFDDLTVKLQNPAYRLEWTDRKKPQNADESPYVAWIEIFNYQFKNQTPAEDKFVCRSVSNHADNIVLSLRSGVNGTQKYIDVIEKPGDDEPLQSSAPELALAEKVKFNVIDSPRGHFFQCQLEDGSLGKIVFEKCFNGAYFIKYSSSAYCANTLRYLKMKEHNLNLTYMTSVSRNVERLQENWIHLGNVDPGVAVCINDKKPGSPKVGAVEYFFSTNPPPTIYFSWSNIIPEHQIRLLQNDAYRYNGHFEDYYFVNDKVDIVCQVPRYGFSADPVLVVTLNGSVIPGDSNNEMKFNVTDQYWKNGILYHLNNGPGNYKFECIAPVWNTTEWANTTLTVTALTDPIAPYFEQNYTEIYLQDTETSSQPPLLCDARGFPTPEEFVWLLEKEELRDQDNHYLAKVELGEISTSLRETVLKKVSQLKFATQHFEFTCKAKNRFGQTATKNFKIIYTPQHSNWKENVATMLDQGPIEDQTTVTNETNFIQDILHEISVNVENKNYNGTEIKVIVTLVNRATTYYEEGTTETTSNQLSTTKSAVDIFNSILDNKRAWNKLEPTQRSDAATNILTSTDRILLDVGRNKAAQMQNSSSVSIVIDSTGPMKAFVGVEQSEISSNSSLKLFFDSNSVNLTNIKENGNRLSLNSIELPSGWKSIAAGGENDLITYAGTSLRSEVAKDLFKVKTMNSTAIGAGFVVNSDVVSFTIGESSKSVAKKIHFPGKGISIEFSNRIPTSSGYCGNVRGKVIEANAPEPIKVDRDTATCVYWDETNLVWSPDDCKLLAVNKTHTVCECSHLTAFSVLMKPFAHEADPDHALEIITNILCPISIVCLLISIWILSIVKSNTLTLQSMNRITLHLCICLIITNTMTFLFMDKTHFILTPTVCYMAGAFTHYILLCAFLLMGMEAIHLYKLTVKVFQSGRNYFVIQYALAYTIPAVIVGITMLVGVLNEEAAYGNDIFCWLNGYYLLGGFVLPGGILLLANLVLLSTALYHAKHRSRRFVSASKRINEQRKSMNKNVCGNDERENSNQRILENLGAYLFWTKSVFALCVLLGVTWIFGWFLLVCNEIVSQIAAYIFTLLNASQGIFILLFHCIGNTNIRQDLLRKIQSWTIYREFSSLVKSNNNTNTNSSSADSQPLKIMNTRSNH